MLIAWLGCAHLPDPVASTREVEVRALVDEDWIGVRFDMSPGWHIYWTNPGQSGMATHIEGAGTPYFPGPERFTSPGDIVSYGWGDSVVALLEAPEDIVTLDVEWLACRRACKLQQASFQVDPSLHNAKLRKHVAELPRPAGELSFHREGDWVVLEAQDFFPTVETEANLGAVDQADGHLRLKVSGPLSGLALARGTYYEMEIP